MVLHIVWKRNQFITLIRSELNLLHEYKCTGSCHQRQACCTIYSTLKKIKRVFFLQGGHSVHLTEQIPPCQLSVALEFNKPLNRSNFEWYERYRCPKVISVTMKHGKASSNASPLFDCCCPTIGADLWFIFYWTWPVSNYYGTEKDVWLYPICTEERIATLRVCASMFVLE